MWLLGWGWAALSRICVVALVTVFQLARAFLAKSRTGSSPTTLTERPTDWLKTRARVGGIVLIARFAYLNAPSHSTNTAVATKAASTEIKKDAPTEKRGLKDG